MWAKHPDLKPGAGRMLELMCGSTSSDEELLNLQAAGDSPDGGPSKYLMPNRSRSKKSVLKPLTELSAHEKADKLKQQALTNDYHKFVEGNLVRQFYVKLRYKSLYFHIFYFFQILKQGILDKKKGLFAKRRMFLLTEGPHLYYVDPSAMVLKGKNLDIFCSFWLFVLFLLF